MNEKIRKELIYKAVYEFRGRYINKSDIERIVNDIPESEFIPKSVEREIDADKKRLFDNKVSDVIDYLSSYKECEFRQIWTGYESNYFAFIKCESETEDEIFWRLRKLVTEKCKSLSEKMKDVALLKKRRKELQEEITELNKKIKSV